MIPYGHQFIDEEDIRAVEETLRSPYLTQGPQVEKFEKALAEYSGSKYALAVSSGTAALHAAYFAAGLGPGDEFITSPITFAATSNVGLWQGAKPVFVDIEPATGNIDVNLIEEKITPRTKALVPVDYTGRPANLAAVKEIAKKYNLLVIEDACQALGAEYNGKKIGSNSDLTILSFHPVKSITTGEGGAVLTNNENFYKKMKLFRSHGITKEREELTNEERGDWYNEMQELGLNYRLTDLQCALGISQLGKLDDFIKRRREIANRYGQALFGLKGLALPPIDSEDIKSSWHLYVIRVQERAEVLRALRQAKIGAQVHHIPVYLHPYYRKLGYQKGLCPEAEKFYQLILSLPIYPGLSQEEQSYVVQKLL